MITMSNLAESIPENLFSLLAGLANDFLAIRRKFMR
jgi:hypothetical protein